MLAGRSQYLSQYNPPTSAITSPTGGTNFVTGLNITINATATDNGSIASVNFYANGALLGVDTTSPYTWTWNNAPLGSYNLMAVATDDSGYQTPSAMVNVIIGAATITKQPVNQAVDLGQTATFTVAAAGSGLTYQWQKYTAGSWQNVSAPRPRTTPQPPAFRATTPRNTASS